MTVGIKMKALESLPTFEKELDDCVAGDSAQKESWHGQSMAEIAMADWECEHGHLPADLAIICSCWDDPVETSQVLDERRVALA